MFIEKVETGSEDLEVETTKFQLEEIEDDVLARARDIRRWRETGEIALEQDFAVRLTVEGGFGAARSAAWCTRTSTFGHKTSSFTVCSRWPTRTRSISYTASGTQPRVARGSDARVRAGPLAGSVAGAASYVGAVASTT